MGRLRKQVFIRGVIFALYFPHFRAGREVRLDRLIGQGVLLNVDSRITEGKQPTSGVFTSYSKRRRAGYV